MIQKLNIRRSLKVLSALFFAVLLVSAISPCENNKDIERPSSTTESVVGIIETEEQFNETIESSGDRLLMFELYADWCAPCKKLSLILEEIVKKNRDKVTAFKINIDENRTLIDSLQMTGIPLVLFFKNKKKLHSIVGLHPKDDYVKAIKQFSRTSL